MMKERVAIITGGTRGIGKAISLEFLKRGAKLIICYRANEESKNKMEEEIRAAGYSALFMKGDVYDPNFADTVVKRAVGEFGKIDILVNNAGITKDKLLIRMSEADFQEVMDVNLTGSFNFLKASSEIMMKNRYGRIINMSSISGLIGNPGQINYSASKAAIVGMTKAAAKELGKRGITVNAIAPGLIETEMTDILTDNQKEQLMSRVALGKIGRAEDVAYLAAFLASEQAGYITGQVIGIDGGM